MSWQRLRRLGSNSGGSSPLLGGRDKKKEDKENANLTPLERLLQESGKSGQPVLEDGSDKFFGLENFGNTCYANSILQSLYYSEPFREEVINYPERAPIETVVNGPDGQPRPLVKISPQSLVAQRQQRNPNSPATARTPVKPEDKGSAEYKKKQALLKGPVVPMDYDNSQNYGMSESLFTSLKDFFEGIIANQARMGVVRPSKLVDTLKKERMEFNTGQHQDAHEFLNLLLNSVIDTVEADTKSKVEAETNGSALVQQPGVIHEDDHSKLNGAPVEARAGTERFNPIRDLFQGTLTSETVCLTCEKVSQRDEPFNDLSVDIEQHSSVAACLRQFSEEEILSERNKFSCDNCGYTESQKRMKIKKLPRILALHLKRFKPIDDGGWRFQKLFHRVVYPFHLRLFDTTDDAEDPERIYELYAVVVHIGAGPFQGHYVAVVKTKEAGWVLYDDELVEPVKKEFVQNFFGDRPGQAAAYVLFYQETTTEKVNQELAREGMPQMTPQMTPQTPQIHASPPEPLPVKSPGLGLTLNPLSPSVTRNSTIIETPIEEAAASEEALATAQTVSPSLLPTNGSTPEASQSELSQTTTTLSNGTYPLVNGNSNHHVPPPTSGGGFLNRMRRSSKSTKRPNFFGSLDLTKEGKNKTQNGTKQASDKSKDNLMSEPMDTPTQENPYPAMNSAIDSSAEALPSVHTETKETEQPAPSGSVGKKRFLSIRRKTAELRKSGSRGNILSSRKEERVEG